MLWKRKDEVLHTPKRKILLFNVNPILNQIEFDVKFKIYVLFEKLKPEKLFVLDAFHFRHLKKSTEIYICIYMFLSSCFLYRFPMFILFFFYRSVIACILQCA